MITYKGGQFMEKEKKIRIAILIILAGLALLAVLFGRNLEQWAGKDSREATGSKKRRQRHSSSHG